MEDLKKSKSLELNQGEKEGGASMLEYALLAALIAIAAIAGAAFLGQQASNTFSSVGNTLENANTT